MHKFLKKVDKSMEWSIFCSYFSQKNKKTKKQKNKKKVMTHKVKYLVDIITRRFGVVFEMDRFRYKMMMMMMKVMYRSQLRLSI